MRWTYFTCLGTAYSALERARLFRDGALVPTGAIGWGDEIELCLDALYMQLAGKTIEEVMPTTRILAADA